MSHVNQSCPISMSHFIYRWVMSNMNESCHIWMSNISYEWLMSHKNESCRVWMSNISHEWVMSHMHESCHMIPGERNVYGVGGILYLIITAIHQYHNFVSETFSWILCHHFSGKYVLSQKILTQFSGVPYFIFNHPWCCALVSRNLIYMCVFHMCDMNELYQTWLSHAEY